MLAQERRYKNVKEWLATFGPAIASRYIRRLEVTPGDRFILCVRASTSAQARRESLDDQEARLRSEIESKGGIVLHVVRHIGSGWGPMWLSRAAALALEIGASLVWDEYSDTEQYNGVPKPVPLNLLRPGVFIFLGKITPLRTLDLDDVLNDFDSLLPLYRHVERRENESSAFVPIETNFAFRPGCRPKPRAVIVQRCREQVARDLRHNRLQERLYKRLVKQFGQNKVGTEIAGKNGCRIDLVVQHERSYSFYEIKTADSARACIREALGQILEYAFWPGAQQATKLVIVGEHLLDKEGDAYLSDLKKRFSLPLSYETLTVP